MTGQGGRTGVGMPLASDLKQRLGTETIRLRLPGCSGEDMGTVTNITKVKFSVGELIHHRLFGYRGVIVDVDRNFQATEEWYEMVAKSRPPKNQPWYHVLVHGSDHSTYVAEQNLAADEFGEAIDHPMTGYFFAEFVDGKYVRNELDG